MKNTLVSLLLASLCTVCACSDDPTPEGQGTSTFTTWGEEYIEEGIPAGGDGGFVDGWSVKYSKFLYVFGSITVAEESGAVGASLGAETLLVDNVIAGKKTLTSFANLPARAYTKVGYQSVPATASTRIISGTQADLDLMVANGYRIYVEGTATGPNKETKSFKWGFTGTVTYSTCQARENDQNLFGLVVTDGATDTAELTTHGDHLFYNRLQPDDSGVNPTELRFQRIADADKDGDDVVSLDELAAVAIEDLLVPKELGYDPSGLPASNFREFLTELSKTVGHYRGEGECTVTR